MVQREDGVTVVGDAESHDALVSAQDVSHGPLSIGAGLAASILQDIPRRGPQQFVQDELRYDVQIVQGHRSVGKFRLTPAGGRVDAK